MCGSYYLVPPHNHQASAAERAIQTFKHHFKACLTIIDPDFPLREQDRLSVQAELTMNLLLSAKINPKLCTYAYLVGNFDFNKTPIEPPGTRVVVHSKPSKRSSWDTHVI